MTKGQHLKGDRPTHIEDGCSLWEDSCLSCPFRPDCIIKDRDVLKTPKIKAKTTQLHQEGFEPEEIAKRLGKSLRTIQRWLK
ncbi:helix-turn-helix domain-containing protein [Patescibacteria group bacterium]|nr:helix-turn-helix domain-containing protein [Patescibacteria group bacterium]